ncbi:SNF2 family N-terminal domain-containing protein [Coprinopsis sp. MPI-PUGE-AT-0042]|nr:SNF2 family N-terminal domain-containing protein [Coprinopsis sp. MPI-PUGE-AT-0042]
MAYQHVVGYSKSTRAKCHGPPPCQGSTMTAGTLRYGGATGSEQGENIQWRHWGCVTPDILDDMARTSINGIVDFTKLRPADQQRIRMAIALRRIDPADVPASAKGQVRMQQAALSQPVRPPPMVQAQKRKAEEPPVASSSKGGMNIPKASAPLPPSVPVNNPNGARRFSEEEEDTGDTTVEEVSELYCVMQTNVVGIKYYNGLVGNGEQVTLVREPTNRFDSNAVKVTNIQGIQIGHIPKNVAGRLAPLLDQRLVTVEGIINEGNIGAGRNQWQLPMTLKIFAPGDKRAEMEPKLVWATPGQRGFGNQRNGTTASARPSASQSMPTQVVGSLSQPGTSSQTSAQSLARQEAIRKQQEALRKAAELRQMLDSLEKVDDEGRRSSLLDTVCSKDDILNLPLHPSPPGTATGELKVDLLKHQSQALAWCIDRENPKLPKKETDEPVQFWQLRKSNGKTYYLNVATKTPQEQEPALGKGAICADAMGLGKTLTMLSLILATKDDNHPNFSKSTLIVAPVSILSNWEKQIQDHVVLGVLSTYLYYGNNRSISADDLKKYDIVITTYQTITGEHPESAPAGNKRRKSLTGRCLRFLGRQRIILDEGHVIRNPKTKMAKAVVDLPADRRWVLSGTPIINSPRDLGSMLTFLRICKPLDNEDYFKRLLIRPLKNGEPEGAEMLKALMTHVCIRRTKEMQDSNGVPLIALPPVEMIRIPVTLEPEARELYDEIETISSQRVERMMANANTVVQSNVLSMLTRLRQISLHPGLVPPDYLEELRSARDADAQSDEAAQTLVTPEEKYRLQSLLSQAIEDCEECPICFNVLEDARITSCSHMFCVTCIMEAITRDPRCPMDGRMLSVNDLFERLPPTELTQKPVRDFIEDEPEGIRAGSSAKIDQLVQLLRLAPKDEKSLVFSQFTSFLDKVGEQLEAEGIPYVRFDGQMSAKRRQEAIARFSVPVTLGPAAKASSQSTQRTSSQATQNGRPRRSTRRASAMSVVADDGDSGDEYNPGDEDSDQDDFEKDDFADDVDLEMLNERDRSDDVNPRVMLISLKAGALGLNLTVANHVYLMDPWWQEGIESQAVDRVNRIGQTRPVHVYQLIAEDTVESKVLEIQDRKKDLIKQAFAGIKSRETQRQQREARLQDLVELFNRRRGAQAQEEPAPPQTQEGADDSGTEDSDYNPNA